MADWNDQFDAIVIGSGFGGSVAITKLATEGAELLDKPNPRILVLERGTWWRNPEGPGLRNHNTKKSGIFGKWQYWARPNDSQGLAYVANSIYKEHNPIWDLLNPFLKDNDLGIKKNRKGMYRLSRFEHDKGNVDVISGSAVGGGSLFYSGVNLIPHEPVLSRIGLGHLTGNDFHNAGQWMKKFRGHINKINTKIPVPQYMPKKPEDLKLFQLSKIPESSESPVDSSKFEMPNPILTRQDREAAPDDLEPDKLDADYLLLDRARVLRRSMNRVVDQGGFGDGSGASEVWNSDGTKDGFEPLPLSVVEYDTAKPEADLEPDEKNTDSTEKNTYCSREGRCILGCLPSARHTLYKTIQKRQQEGGDITVLPMTKVSHIDKHADGSYTVRFKSELEGELGEITSATSSKVFMGAGCLGTTEIMLRSQAKFDESGGSEGISLSPMMGKGFSTNGDFFAFTYDMDRDYKTRSVDHSDNKDDRRIGNANSSVGPINSSHFYVIFDKDTDQRVDVNVEDAGIPTTFARLVHGLLPYFNDWQKFMTLGKALLRFLLNMDPFPSNESADTEAREQVAYMTEREILSSVFFYNLMGSAADEPLGTFSIQSDGSGLDLSYDQELAEWDVFKKHEKVLNQLTDAMADKGDDEQDEDGNVRGPRLMMSPFWLKDKRVTVVHPLGGCPIGADSSTGAVDDNGRVYNGSSSADSQEVHEGLYVLDASAIPGALGVNPTYTIVTHAVRCMESMK